MFVIYQSNINRLALDVDTIIINQTGISNVIYIYIYIYIYT